VDSETITNDLPGIQERACKSWPDFKIRIYEDLFGQEADPYRRSRFERGRFIFRGHASSEWRLVPTFDRWFSGPPKQKPKIANELLDLFIDECEAQENLPADVIKDKRKMLGIAQHHGLPTRLLDWTASPYIAAFFAFSGLLSQQREVRAREGQEQVVVWVLDSHRSIWEPHFGVEIIEVPRSSNYRLRHQTAKFTHLTTQLYGSLEGLVGRYVTEVRGSETEEAVLMKYLIPAEQTRAALADLDLMGINYSRIFPDREGYALAAKMGIALKHDRYAYGW